jgi:hypothetical protein
MEVNDFDDVVYHVEKCVENLRALRRAAHNLPPDGERTYVDAIRAAIRAFDAECDRVIGAYADGSDV